MSGTSKAKRIQKAALNMSQREGRPMRDQEELSICE
jgi:hypothetical protein